MAKLLSEIAAQHKDRKTAIITAYKAGAQPARYRRVLSIAPNDDWGYCSQEQKFLVLDLICFGSISPIFMQTLDHLSEQFELLRMIGCG
jgi:hypothetical protein